MTDVVVNCDRLCEVYRFAYRGSFHGLAGVQEVCEANLFIQTLTPDEAQVFDKGAKDGCADRSAK